MLRSQLLSPPVCVHLENELLTPASSVPDFVHSIRHGSIFVPLFSTEMLSRADCSCIHSISHHTYADDESLNVSLQSNNPNSHRNVWRNQRLTALKVSGLQD